MKGEVLDGEREWSSVPPVNSERRKELFKKGFGSKAFVEFVKQQPCVVEACNRTPIDCAHVTSRGAGGGPEDIVPMCRHHHAEQHAMGIETFQRVYGLDLDLLAGLTWQEFTG